MIQDYTDKVRLVLWQILFANLIVAVTKIIIGNIIQSASMTADGFHSLTDGVSNVVGLVGLSMAAKPSDPGHPYGHRKCEFLTSLFIGGMLLVIAAKICIEAFGRIANPVTPQFGAEAIALLTVTLVINIAVCIYEYRKGKRYNSYILIADSLHTKSDIYISTGVLLTLVAIKAGASPVIDPIASIVVAGFILYAGFGIVKSTSAILIDTAAVDHDLVIAITMNFAQVKGVHKVRSRGTAPDLFVDMHIFVAPAMSTEESHKLVHEIENKLKLEINPNIQVMIHTEPYESMHN